MRVLFYSDVVDEGVLRLDYKHNRNRQTQAIGRPVEIWKEAASPREQLEPWSKGRHSDSDYGHVTSFRLVFGNCDCSEQHVKWRWCRGKRPTQNRNHLNQV